MVEKKVWNPEMMNQAQAPPAQSSGGCDPLKLIAQVINSSNTKSMGSSRRRGLYNYAALQDDGAGDSVVSDFTGPDGGLKLLDGNGDARRGSNEGMDSFKDEERWYEGRDSLAVALDHKSKFYEGLGKIELGLGAKTTTMSEASIRVPLVPTVEGVDVLGDVRRSGSVGLKVDSGKKVKKKAMARVERLHFGIDFGEQEKPG